MARTLGWVAAGGLAGGVFFLAMAVATGGHDVRRLIEASLSLGRSCGGDDAATTLSERRLAWTGGDTVEIALPATVRYRAGEGDEVIVRGPSAVIAHVETKGGRIVLDCRSSARRREVEIVLPGRTFSRMSLSGSGRLLLENLSQPTLALAISGSGDVRAQGKVELATVTISGSGHARLGDLALQQLTVTVSGSGHIEAAPKDLADITISGAGNVRLLTRPAQLRSHVSGSGRITQAPLESADGKK